jgi:choline dehydrogenase-like flavoprotein
MSHVDGTQVTATKELEVDVAIVGSGPAGAAAARELALGGARVAVLEAGPWVRPEAFPIDAFTSMADLYRDMGASVVLGKAPMPFLQGRMVGGSSPINGAICWRMPRNVYDEWVARDPALGDAIPWAELETATDHVEALLNVAPTDPAVAGRKNQLMAKGAEALGLEHRPIRRNVDGCEGLGRCIQGCPAGRKRSAEVAFLPDAMDAGTTVLSCCPVDGIDLDRGRAVGLRARAAGGGEVNVAAGTIILAASAVQTPGLLLANRIRHGPVGRHFSCHPGASMAGRFAEPVRMWEGATQGHEVIGLRHEGLKFEALGFGLSILAARMTGFGRGLAARVSEMAHWCDWGVAVRAKAQGRVRLVRGKPVVLYSPTRDDVRNTRRGLRVLGEMMFAAGADEVAPGVHGFAQRVTDPRKLQELEERGPTNPAAIPSAITHMFGTCRMGSSASTSVVGTDFRHHAVDGLYIADSSVFPSSLGVNPQVAIMALATLCARRVLGAR